MTREEAIKILDPETTAEALAEIEYYGGFNGGDAKVQAVSNACVLAVAALREQEERRWIPVTERKYAVRDIMDAPTVDAVEVVRCGKCDFRKYTKNAYKVFVWNCTNKLSPCRGRTVGDADFCPYGERRTDG